MKKKKIFIFLRTLLTKRCSIRRTAHNSVVLLMFREHEFRFFRSFFLVLSNKRKKWGGFIVIWHSLILSLAASELKIAFTHYSSCSSCFMLIKQSSSSVLLCETPVLTYNLFCVSEQSSLPQYVLVIFWSQYQHFSSCKDYVI